MNNKSQFTMKKMWCMSMDMCCMCMCRREIFD